MNEDKKEVKITASVCLYLRDHSFVSLRNIRYLSRWSTSQPNPSFEVIVCYAPNLDIAELSGLYPDIRWHRLIKPPRNRFFLYRHLSRKIRSKIFIFVSSYVLIGKRDIFALANDSLKKDTLFSYMENPRCLFLSQKGGIIGRLGYCINYLCSEVYRVLNHPLRVSSIEIFAFHTESLQNAFSALSRREKYQFFQENFSINSYKKDHNFLKNRAYFDYFFFLVAFRAGMKINSPGRSCGRWLLPTNANFFPLFLFCKQAYLLIKLMKSHGYVPNIINYKRILMLVSQIALCFFFFLTYLGYHDTWLLLIFFIVCNIPFLASEGYIRR